MARLDAELVRRGLARSRGDARELLAAGAVRLAGRPVHKPATPVAPQDDIDVADPEHRWVGRAARKLHDALAAWEPEGLRVAGQRCVDVGASTGGFTQVLLAAGAATVEAVDVGHGQLAPELACDPRVTDRSGTTVRGLTAADLGGAADLVVADLSFISLTLVLPELAGLLGPGGDLVLLVKPQFEVGRARLGKGGLVTDPAERAAALTTVAAAVRGQGLHVRGIRPSPVTGTNGNAEYLLWARSDPSDTMDADRLAAAVREVTTGQGSGGRRR